MRIRKRQEVVMAPPRPTIPALKGSGYEEEPFVCQNSCICCARQRRLQEWELRNSFDRESGEPSNGLAAGILVADKNQAVDYVRTETQLSETEKLRRSSKNPRTEDLNNSEMIDAEENESNAAMTLGRSGDKERVGDNENNGEATGIRAAVYVSAQSRNSEVDVNHPGNKSKESLLHSLYYVFTKLSGKAVLTAREALSRIIDERLPGLDEEAGLPSLQVAKLLRSNPYFVHLGGGKFVLCSAPSSDSKEEPDSGDVLDNEDPPRLSSPSFRPKSGTRNFLSREEISKEKQQQQQLFSNTDVLRTKRARSKAVAIIDGAFDKTGYRSRGSRREGQKASKPPDSVLEQDKYLDDPVERICKRYDGRGWKCHETALPGYTMCRHHHELIVNRLARLRSSGRLGSKTSFKRRKTTAKTLKEVPDVVNEGEASVNNDQSGAHWWKNVKARSLKSINP